MLQTPLRLRATVPSLRLKQGALAREATYQLRCASFFVSGRWGRGHIYPESADAICALRRTDDHRTTWYSYLK